jgi:hypothetical protein
MLLTLSFVVPAEEGSWDAIANLFTFKEESVFFFPFLLKKSERQWATMSR